MLKFLLLPLTVLYGLVVFIRNQLYDLKILKSVEFDIPVISVGNITVGGTGKTPHVEYIASLLKDKYNVSVLSRGYGRKTKGFLNVETNSSVVHVGDEPLQIKQKFPEITVAVCENRVRGIKMLLKDSESKPDVVILDDAFQHRRITPGINILLVDYNRPISEDLLLPSGRLREGATQIQRAGIIVFTKCPDEVSPIQRRILKKDVNLKPYQQLYFSGFSYRQIKPVFIESPEIEDFGNVREFNVLVVTGIASPKPIHKYLEKNAKEIYKLVFPDHHFFTDADILKIITTFDEIKSEKKIIITTSKDMLRFKELKNLNENLKKTMYYLPVEVKFLSDEGKNFNNRIIEYVGENKGNRELYQRKDKRTT